jgi:hypothetical protein
MSMYLAFFERLSLKEVKGENSRENREALSMRPAGGRLWWSEASGAPSNS